MFALLTDITETRVRSLQQWSMNALADEIPHDIADRLCRRSRRSARRRASSVVHIDAAGLVYPLGGPRLAQVLISRLMASRLVRTSAPAAPRPSTASRAGDRIATDPRWNCSRRCRCVGLRACWSTLIRTRTAAYQEPSRSYFREYRRESRWHQHRHRRCVDLSVLAIEGGSRAQIARLAYRLTLTGLPNRARLRDRFPKAAPMPARGHWRWRSSMSTISRTSTTRSGIERRRIAGAVRPAPARTGSAGRTCRTSRRRRIRDRAAEPRRRAAA